MSSATPKQPFLEKRTDAENIGSNDTKANDDQTQYDRQYDVKYEVMRIALEEFANVW